jgi:hypothetical protein
VQEVDEALGFRAGKVGGLEDALAGGDARDAMVEAGVGIGSEAAGLAHGRCALDNIHKPCFNILFLSNARLGVAP